MEAISQTNGQGYSWQPLHPPNKIGYFRYKWMQLKDHILWIRFKFRDIKHRL